VIPIGGSAGICGMAAIGQAELSRLRTGRGDRILFKPSNSRCCWNTNAFVRRCAKLGRALYPLYAPAD
jgi:hypothetical protein